MAYFRHSIILKATDKQNKNIGLVTIENTINGTKLSSSVPSIKSYDLIVCSDDKAERFKVQNNISTFLYEACGECFAAVVICDGTVCYSGENENGFYEKCKKKMLEHKAVEGKEDEATSSTTYAKNEKSLIFTENVVRNDASINEIYANKSGVRNVHNDAFENFSYDENKFSNANSELDNDNETNCLKTNNVSELGSGSPLSYKSNAFSVDVESVAVPAARQVEVVKTYNDAIFVTENYFDKEISISELDPTEVLEAIALKEDVVGGTKEKRAGRRKIDSKDREQGNGGQENSMAFYLKIKEDIDNLFANFPSDEFLEKIIPGSLWVKINFDSLGSTYSVGLLKEGELVKYISYAIDGVYSKTPPNELANCSQFLPKNFENPTGEGYWLMYQSAVDGEVMK